MDKLKYYLGTGLKIRLNSDSGYDEEMFKTDYTLSHFGLNQKGVITYRCMETMQPFQIHESKPLMRPLSSLTKPITVEGYNGGEPFVPVDELNRLFGWKDNGVYLTEYHGLTGVSNGIGWHVSSDFANTAIPFNNWFGAFEALISWHFWIGDQSEFGKSLIEIKE